VRAVPRGRDALRISVIRRVFPRGYGEDLNVRAPRDGPGWLPPDLDVRAPADGLLSGLAVSSGGAHGAPKEERRDPRPDAGGPDAFQAHRLCAGAAGADRAARAAGVGWNIQEPRHGVHAVLLEK